MIEETCFICGGCGHARPAIAQAIHDAALSWPLGYPGRVEDCIVSEAFMSLTEWSHIEDFDDWLTTTEGRTYMLLCAEALS